MAFIEIQDLHYQYKDGTVALNGLNLQIGKGEIFGFLGPNGAGKTTTLNLLVGLLDSNQGRILIHGQQMNNQEREIYRKIGFMPEVKDSYDKYSVKRFLQFFGRCHDMTDKEIDLKCNNLLQIFNLTEKQDKLLGNLSKGEKQKVYFLRTIIHDPDILILDEPANGLDAGSRIFLNKLLKDAKNIGKTIIISSHILREIEDLCTSIGIIDRGKLVEYGRINELIVKHQNPIATYKIHILEGLNTAKKVLNSLNENELQRVQSSSDKKILEIDYSGDEHQVANLLEMFVESGVRISSFERMKKDIETIYGEILNV